MIKLKINTKKCARLTWILLTGGMVKFAKQPSIQNIKIKHLKDYFIKIKYAIWIHSGWIYDIMWYPMFPTCTEFRAKHGMHGKMLELCVLYIKFTRDSFILHGFLVFKVNFCNFNIYF